MYALMCMHGRRVSSRHIPIRERLSVSAGDGAVLSPLPVQQPLPRCIAATGGDGAVLSPLPVQQPLPRYIAATGGDGAVLSPLPVQQPSRDVSLRRVVIAVC